MPVRTTAMSISEEASRMHDAASGNSARSCNSLPAPHLQRCEQLAMLVRAGTCCMTAAAAAITTSRLLLLLLLLQFSWQGCEGHAG
jgi:hypothetical protein